MTPLIVCTNIHTVCRGCTKNIRHMQTSKCPQCRTEMWKHDVVNRDLIYFMGKLSLRCGGCLSKVRMSCATALKRSRECLENHVACPLLNNDPALSRCNQSMSMSNLWQHCTQYHSENSQSVIIIDASEISANEMTATISVSIILDVNSYTFFQIRTNMSTYNMCMHITAARESESQSDSVFFCFRRFFPEVCLSFQRMFMSVTVGDMCGMLLPVPSVVSVYENMQSLKDLPKDERLCKMIQLPCDLFKQIEMYSLRDDTMVESSIGINLGFRADPITVAQWGYLLKSIAGMTHVA